MPSYFLHMISIAALIFLVSFMDGWRDSLIKRRSDVPWIRYHLVKWMAFYPPLIALWVWMLKSTNLPFAMQVVITCIWAFLFWAAWQLGARVSGEPTYHSWISTLFSKRNSRND